MLHEAEASYVNARTERGVTTIEFFHPQGNSLPLRLMQDISTEIHSAAQDAGTRVIVLRSGGERTFCAGASFAEVAAIDNEERSKKFFMGFAQLINEMRKCPKFIVARVQGKCVGGGVGLAAAADYSIATEAAEVKLSELAIGIGPFVVGPVIERKIGLSAFSQLAIDATQWRPADWARRKGLFAELHPSIPEMDESVERLSDQLAHSSPLAMADLKKIFWQGTEHWDELLAQRAGISGKLLLTDFSRQALANALKK